MENVFEQLANPLVSEFVESDEGLDLIFVQDVREELSENGTGFDGHRG
jgi:hypothetical protein